MPKIDLNSIVQRNPETLGAEAGEDLVMVSVEHGQYYAVSRVAKEIWQAVHQPMTVSNLVDELLLRYNVDRAVCEKDTLRYLEELFAEHLLQVKECSDCSKSGR